jgi:hypothetical protein
MNDTLIFFNANDLKEDAFGLPNKFSCFLWSYQRVL